MYRILRASEVPSPDGVRFVLRAVPVKQDGRAGHEVAREYDTSLVRDKLALGQAIPTPEETFEQLWQQLRIDLDVNYD
jgi:hypothetical protein